MEAAATTAEGRPAFYPIGAKSKAAGAPKRDLLGLKGKALAELARIGAPVPTGLILSTALCESFLADGSVLPKDFDAELRQHLAPLEKATGKRFGDPANPLLVSLRCSPAQQVSVLIKSVLNIGMSEAAVKALQEQAGDARFAWDAYARFLRGFSVHVMRLDPDPFEDALGDILQTEQAEDETALNAKAMEELAHSYQTVIHRVTGKAAPEDAWTQLRMAIEAGFQSWRHVELDDVRSHGAMYTANGTALVIQPMVFGTAPGLSGAGRFFTRHPASGDKALYGRFLFNAMGPDLTAGLRLADPLDPLFKKSPELRTQLEDWRGKLEKHFHDAVEVHFAVEGGKLQLLQCLSATRTGRAGMRIALEMVEEGLASEKQALLHLDAKILNEYLHPVLDPSAKKNLLTKGLPASPGSAVGQVVFFAEQAEELTAQGIKTILVRHETTPEDIGGLSVSQGILTATGGLTSHAAVVGRGMGKCCVVGAGEIHINYLLQEMAIGGKIVRRLDWISLDGNTGEVFEGKLPQVQPTLEGGAAKVLGWADKIRRLRVRANADTPADAKQAVELGAEGIGLCRTEHMFFHLERIPVFRKMILASDVVGRSAALAELLPLQRKDFMDLFRVMNGRPVTIRLLDPPLHEFLPRGIRSQTRMAKAMGIPVEAVQRRTETLHETNPMLGHRGCRLAITYPEIYQMQVRAIVEAACIVTKEKVEVHPEIMVPLVSTTRELDSLREDIETLTKRVMEEMGEDFPIPVGTMIETPRAAICAGSIARYADFFSFGTNDLTQMSFGFSRDDAGMFLPTYVAKGILEHDPFVELDQVGVGALMRIAVEQGRRVNPKLKIGICGEHGGDPASVHFTHALNFDYVSCSPFRIPIARLAAAQAAVMEDEGML